MSRKNIDRKDESKMDMTANDEFYGDILDDLDEIRPDDVREETVPAYVTEPFDLSPYRIFFSIRMPHFMNYIPEDKRAEAVSEIASFITELFTDASLQTETSPVYAFGTSEEFAHKPFLDKTPAWFGAIVLYFGLSFGRSLTVKQCLRILFRIDAVSAFVRNHFYTDSVASSKDPILAYRTTEEMYLIKSMIATKTTTVREYVSSASRSGIGVIKFDRIADILCEFPTRYKTVEEIMDKLQKAIISENALILEDLYRTPSHPNMNRL